MLGEFSFTFDTMTITIIFIILSAFVAAFVRGRKKDKCLKAFRGDLVTLHQVDGKSVWGVMVVENTGIELVYRDKHKDDQGHLEGSSIFYKSEFANINAIVRYFDELDDKGLKERESELAKTYHPNILRRACRKMLNVFRTIRDSIMEVVNLMLARAQQAGGAGKVLSGQDKYVNQMKAEIAGTMGTSYEPLLERHIGHKVVLETPEGDRIVEYCGVLKDYTAEFVELLDVDYAGTNGSFRRADIIVPRSKGIVRHLGE